MPQSADLIVDNARILTMDPDTAAGRGDCHQGRRNRCDRRPRNRSASSRDPAPSSIDAGGNSVVPGFIEAHMHLFAGAAELDHLQLSGVHGFDALAQAVRAYAAAQPDAKLLQAQGADYTILSDSERVTRHHLDRIIADRPFAMAAPDHHTMWANTRALEARRPAARQDARAGQRDRHGRRRAGRGRIARGRGVRAAARSCRREPRAAGPGDRRRAGSRADAAGAGARSRHHEARAGMVRPAWHHLDPEHGRQSATSSSCCRRSRPRAGCFAARRSRSTTRTS